MSKILKILIAFLVSISFVTPFSVKATDEIIININGENENLLYIDPNMPSLLADETISIGSYSSAYTNISGELIWANFSDSTIYIDSSITTLRILFRLGSTIPEGNYNFKLNISHSSYDVINTSTLRIYKNYETPGAMTSSLANILKINSQTTMLEFDNVEISEGSSFVRLDINISIDKDSNNRYPLNLKVNSITYNEGSTNQLLNGIMTWLELIDTRLGLINTNLSVLVSQLIDEVESGFSSVGSWITNQTLALENHITQLFNSLDTWITNQTSSINNKLQNLLGSDSNFNDDLNDANDKNDELSQDVDDYNELENEFHNDMNVSLENIDLNVDLITGNDFIATATFISTNMNRIVTSNRFYQSFVIMGLILGLALVMIGKKVI